MKNHVQRRHAWSSIILLLLTISSLCAGFHAEAYRSDSLQGPADASFTAQVHHFLAQLVKAPRVEGRRVFGEYEATISKHIDTDKLHVVSFEAVEALLNHAVEESLDSLTLFTLAPLQDQHRFALVLDQQLLEQVNRYFDFHGLFSIALPSIDEGTMVKMKFLVIGQGKFIAGYTANATIKNPDYGFATGKYDYNELFIMDAGHDREGNPGFFNIKGLSAPGATSAWMKGPLDVNIHSMTLIPKPPNGPDICVQYEMWGLKRKTIDSIPIERRTAIR